GDIPIPGSSFDIGSGGSSTFKTAGQIPPPPPIAIAPPPMMAAAPPMAPPSAPAGMPPAPPPAAPMPSMLDVLKQAQAAGSQLYGQYTPDKRNDLYAMLLQKRG